MKTIHYQPRAEELKTQIDQAHGEICKEIKKLLELVGGSWKDIGDILIRMRANYIPSAPTIQEIAVRDGELQCKYDLSKDLWYTIWPGDLMEIYERLCLQISKTYKFE